MASHAGLCTRTVPCISSAQPNRVMFCSLATETLIPPVVVSDTRMCWGGSTHELHLEPCSALQPVFVPRSVSEAFEAKFSVVVDRRRFWPSHHAWLTLLVGVRRLTGGTPPVHNWTPPTQNGQSGSGGRKHTTGSRTRPYAAGPRFSKA